MVFPLRLTAVLVCALLAAAALLFAPVALAADDERPLTAGEFNRLMEPRDRKLEELDKEVGELSENMTALMVQMSALVVQVSNLVEAVDKQGERIDRVEDRLDNLFLAVLGAIAVLAAGLMGIVGTLLVLIFRRPKIPASDDKSVSAQAPSSSQPTLVVLGNLPDGWVGENITDLRFTDIRSAESRDSQ